MATSTPWRPSADWQLSATRPVSTATLAAIDSARGSIHQPSERDLSETVHELLHGLQGTVLVAGGARHIYLLEKRTTEPLVALVDEHKGRFRRVLLAQLPCPWLELRQQFLPATRTNFGVSLHPAPGGQPVEVETSQEKAFRRRFIVLGDVASDALGMLRLRTPCAELVTYTLCPVDWLWSPQQVAVENAHVLQVNHEGQYDAWLQRITDPMLHDAFVAREHELQGRVRECTHTPMFTAIGLPLIEGIGAPNPVLVHRAGGAQEAMLLAPCEGGGRAAPPGTSWATLHHLGAKHLGDRAQPASGATRAAVRDLGLGFAAQARAKGAEGAEGAEAAGLGAARRSERWGAPWARASAGEWPSLTAAEGAVAAESRRAARAAAAAEEEDRFALAEQLALVCLGGMTERWRSRVGETLPLPSLWDRGPWTALHPTWQGAAIGGKAALFAGEAVRATIHEGANDQLLSLAWGSKLGANLSAALTFFKVSTPTSISMWTPAGYCALPFTIPLLASVPLLTLATGAVLRLVYTEVAEKAHQRALLRRGTLLQEILRPSERSPPGGRGVQHGLGWVARVVDQVRGLWVVVTRPSEEPLGRVSEAPGAVRLLVTRDVAAPRLGAREASSDGDVVHLLQWSAISIAGIANPRMQPHRAGDPVAWMVAKHSLAARLEHAAELFEGGGIGGQADPAGLTRPYALRCAMERESFPRMDIGPRGEALRHWSCPLATEAHQARPNAQYMAELLASVARSGVRPPLPQPPPSRVGPAAWYRPTRR